jgi:hypothetical protein
MIDSCFKNFMDKIREYKGLLDASIGHRVGYLPR